jgi:hypothetical protein
MIPVRDFARIVVLEEQAVQTLIHLNPLSRRSKVKERRCFWCLVSSTPAWRPGPDQKYMLCNACWAHLRHRPPLDDKRKQEIVDKALKILFRKVEMAVANAREDEIELQR